MDAKRFFIALTLLIFLTSLVQAELNEEDLCKEEIFKRDNLVKEEFRINCEDKFSILDKRYRTRKGETNIRSIKHYEIVTKESRSGEEIKKRSITKNELFRLRDGNVEKVFLKEYKIVNNKSVKTKVVNHFRGRPQRIRTWDKDTKEQLLSVNLDKRTGKIRSIKRYGDNPTITNYDPSGTISSYIGENNNQLELHEAITPAPSPFFTDIYMGFYDFYNKSVNTTPYNIAFAGDSITRDWDPPFGRTGGGKNIWKFIYEPLGSVNLGIGGDTTGGLLLRLTNGNLDMVESPKIFILLIGTNNLPLGANSEEIFEGVAANAAKIRGAHPDSTLLVMGLLPRGEGTDNEYRRTIREANKLIEGLADEENVIYKDIGNKFLNPDNSLNESLFDEELLHPNYDGYLIWAVEIGPIIQKAFEE